MKESLFLAVLERQRLVRAITFRLLAGREVQRPWSRPNFGIVEMDEPAGKEQGQVLSALTT